MSSEPKVAAAFASPADLLAYVQEIFPQTAELGFAIAKADAHGVTLTLQCDATHLRPGETVSGPTLMWLADCAVYLALLMRIGRVPLAVTTNFHIDFLRKTGMGTVYVEAKLLKVGKRLAVGDVMITADGVDGPVAHASATYAIPSAK